MACCDIEPTIVRGYNVVENDDTPDAETRLYRVLIRECRNPQCPNYKRQWEEKIPLSLNAE